VFFEIDFNTANHKPFLHFLFGGFAIADGLWLSAPQNRQTNKRRYI